MSHVFSLQGHGLYIWGSYLVFGIALAIEPLLLIHRLRRARKAAQAPIDEEC